LDEPATPLDLPVGSSADLPVQPLLQKKFWFSEDANHFNNPLRLVPLEGRIAVVTDAGRDAVDADGAADEST
jgi:hypothetical protein